MLQATPSAVNLLLLFRKVNVYIFIYFSEQMCIFSAVFSAVISETTQIFRDHSFAFDTKLPEMSDVAKQKVLQQQKKSYHQRGST